VLQTSRSHTTSTLSDDGDCPHGRTAVDGDLFGRLVARYERLSYGLHQSVAGAANDLASKVVAGLYEGVTHAELEQLAAETAAYQASYHPDFGRLAARVAVERLHKQTDSSFVNTMRKLHAYRDPMRGTHAPLVTQELLDLAVEMQDVIEPALRYERDFEYDHFGLRTLQRSYLLGKTRGGTSMERPQHMIMRVALAVHQRDELALLEAYERMSTGQYTHATPTLFNAGCPRGQLSSCFLLTVPDDSVEGIFEALRRCALISRSAGGIGLSMSHIRASGSYIRSTGGKANGLVPILRVFDAAARYVDQGGGKRKGAFAIYLEPWHADTMMFLELKKNHGKEEARARDLFYALWVPDLFMRRVQEGGTWSFFCPNEAPGLSDLCGEDFDQLYLRYESEGRARSKLPAQQVWCAILESQMETGTPYMLFKDAANLKSNQRHLGVIRGSNLCTEIIQYTSPDEVAVCNLASIALPRFVRTEYITRTSKGRLPAEAQTRERTTDGAGAADGAGAVGGVLEEYYDLDELQRVAYSVTRALDKVISRNDYPLPQAETSNLRHRPMGIGVQGLADVFALLSLPFESDGARELNLAIFETLYFGALSASCDLAAELGTYPSYQGSPASRGLLQPDLWGITPSSRWDWAGLRQRIQAHGLRNSLLVAPMPTASTAQILGNNECFEPYTSNLYARRTLAGEFFVLNEHLQRQLQESGLWNTEMRDRIIAAGGSVQAIEELPQQMRDVFKTAWEMKQRTIIDMAADRGAYIDQSQSLNLFLPNPNYQQLSSMHFHSWRRGLKTGIYYLRSQPATEAIKFTIRRQGSSAADSCGGAAEPPLPTSSDLATEPEKLSCTLSASPGGCETCGS